MEGETATLMARRGSIYGKDGEEEKLPTYDAGGGNRHAAAEEVDARGGRELMERVFKAVDDDGERFLRRLRDRLDRVGMELPQIEVRYEHLSVEADVHVGKRALPTLINAAINTLEKIS
uniref:Pleiotropic ABC efflux transporter N-terminal domain-containing protein n=1 Tax=Aegilops tauschii TaxID=37682 RepID=M8C3I5_AEGTA